MDRLVIPRQPRFCRWLTPPNGSWALSCDDSLSQLRAGYGGLIRHNMGTPLVAGVVDNYHVLWLELYALYQFTSWR